MATNKSKKFNPKHENKFVKCIELEHLTSETGQLLGFTDGSKSESIKNVFQKGDVLFGKLRPYLKKYHQPSFDGVCSSEIWVLSGKDILNDFLYYLIQTNSFIDLANQSSGSKMPRADWDILENGLFSFAASREQQKIASFLSLIDERIVTQNKIINDLKLLKQALIGKVFTQQLRFNSSNSNNFPKWEEKKIGDLFSFKITNSFSREQLNYQHGSVKNIHYGDIHTRFQTLFDVKKEDVPFINPNINIHKISDDSYCKIGDMIFADASEDLNDVGKSIEIVNLDNQKILSGLHTILARPISNTFSIGFCGYLFKSSSIRTQIQKEAQGSKVLSISTNRLSNIYVYTPCLQEQTKIANFFASIDTKIDIEAKLLQKLEEQKKFLLQNLFV